LAYDDSGDDEGKGKKATAVGVSDFTLQPIKSSPHVRVRRGVLRTAEAISQNWA